VVLSVQVGKFPLQIRVPVRSVGSIGPLPYLCSSTISCNVFMNWRMQTSANCAFQAKQSGEDNLLRVRGVEKYTNYSDERIPV
jgi:hypothetical protein